MNKIKKLAILTSGGDSPGMNAAIRAVTRYARQLNIKTYGVIDGYYGLYHDEIIELNRSSVSSILNLGGTFLGSSRFPEFKNKEIRARAIQNLNEREIAAIVVIGGDGSYKGAKLLSTEFNFPCIGLPGTIDNDIAGTDFTIGFHTALNTIVEAIDKLRDTSSSHRRISIVEIMGRNCGDLTLHAAVAGGCEYVIIPEKEWSYDALVKNIIKGISNGKRHAIVAVTENMIDSSALAKSIEADTKHETRATILGHIQRGGNPVAIDRILASRMGVYAVELLLKGISGCCVGIKKGELVHTDIDFALENVKHNFDEVLWKTHHKLF